ncbi:hypothetical protein GGR58DRAFT_158750 [Xylaria digitata]|nr:hypothetical protein GGR58DRAFT_158750 [Xylaria digitata]
MKNFGAILLVLAAGASSVAALPATGAQPHAISARGHEFYALHVREPKRGGRGRNNGNAGNSTLVANPANNGTADGNDNDNDNGKGKKGKNGKDQGNDETNALLEALLGLLTGDGAGQKAGQDKAAKA